MTDILNKEIVKELAEKILNDERFKASLIRSLIGYMVSQEKQVIKEIQNSIAGDFRDHLDVELQNTIANIKEQIKVKAKNYADNSILKSLDGQLDKLAERFTPDYLKSLTVERIENKIRSKYEDMHVSFRIGDLI